MNNTEARDVLIGFVRTAWLADAATSSLPLLYDDVEGDKPGHDADGNPIAYGRVTVAHLATRTDTIGGIGSGAGSDQHEGAIVVQVFTPRGKGHALGDEIAQVMKAALQRRRSGTLWTFEAGVFEIKEPNQQSAWDQMHVRARFRYSEQLP